MNTCQHEPESWPTQMSMVVPKAGKHDHPAEEEHGFRCVTIAQVKVCKKCQCLYVEQTQQ